MDIQEYLGKLVESKRRDNLRNSPQLTLQEFINEIKKFSLVDSQGNKKSIVYDFGSAVPTKLESWRGSYSELALGYKLTGYDALDDSLPLPTAEFILNELEAAKYKTFEGWKGGEFEMNENTPIWVANPGNNSCSAVVGVIDEGYKLVILTAYCKY